MDLVEHGSLSNYMHFTPWKVTCLPKLNAAINTSLLSLSIILYYDFSSNTRGY